MVARRDKWRKFESLVAEIQKSLSPQASVIQNERVLGVRSNAAREIDIAVRQNVGQFKVFIAVECKDCKRPVDVKEVEAFISKLQDVQANRGVIVSAAGFSGTAKRRAADAGIDVFKLIDTEKHEWQSFVGLAMLVDLVRIAAVSFRFRSSMPVSLPAQDLQDVQLYIETGQLVGTPIEILGSMWNSKSIVDEPGEYEGIRLGSEQMFVLSEGAMASVDVSAAIRVERNHYFGYVPLTSIRGFANQISGGLVTQSCETDLIDLVEVQKTWRKVDSADELPMKPEIVLRCRGQLSPPYSLSDTAKAPLVP